MSQKLTPSLWFDHSAREAVDFYVSVFPDAEVTTVARYPSEGLADFQKDFAGQELEIQFRLGNQGFSAINAGPEFTINPSISVLLNFDPDADEHARQHLDELWAGLGAGGEVLMALDEYDFSPRYGWLRDRYGMTWQFFLGAPGRPQRPLVTPSLMFPHDAARAHRAIELYTSLFDDSGAGRAVPYPPDAGQAPNSLMYADFRLAGQWFSAMDSGEPQDFTFNEGVSLIVQCADQAEIDRLWAVLSTVPEAEQCGWCRDQFGVSWQIVPRDLDELMTHPGAFQAMMSMHKLVIADFG